MVIPAAMPAALRQDHQLVEMLRAVVDRRMGLRAVVTAATAWNWPRTIPASLAIDNRLK